MPGRGGLPQNQDFGGPPKYLSIQEIWRNSAEGQAEVAAYKADIEKKGQKYDFMEMNKHMNGVFKTKVDETKLAALKAKFDEGKATYAAAHEEWSKTDQYAAYKKAETAFKLKKDLKAAKKQAVSDGMPSKPPSGFFIYTNEKRTETMEKLRAQHGAAFKLGMTAGAISEQWNKLTPEQKKVYDDKSAELKKEYQVKLDAFMQSEAGKKMAETQSALKDKDKAKKKKAKDEAREEKLAEKTAAKEEKMAAKEEKKRAREAKKEEKAAKKMKKMSTTEDGGVTATAVEAPAAVAVAQP